jgi:hypothetical protein
MLVIISSICYVLVSMFNRMNAAKDAASVEKKKIADARVKAESANGATAPVVVSAEAVAVEAAPVAVAVEAAKAEAEEEKPASV